MAVVASVVWWAILVILAALALCDVRWLRLPNRLVLLLAVAVLVDVGLRLALDSSLTVGGFAAHTLPGAMVLGGGYAVLHAVSGGRWIGLGDVKLAAVIGAGLGWQHALLAGLIANVLGGIAATVGLLTGALGRKSHLPFGPFLIAGFVIARLWAPEWTT